MHATIYLCDSFVRRMETLGCVYMRVICCNINLNANIRYTGLALCAPSRTIFLTSRRPDTSRVWTISPAQYWRRSGGNFTSLPQHFKDNGYLTIGLGKIFHPGGPSNNSDCEYAKPLTLTLALTPCLTLTQNTSLKVSLNLNLLAFALTRTRVLAPTYTRAPYA